MSYDHKHPRLWVQAERLCDECETCRVLREHGPASPRAMAIISKRLGYPVYGKKWIQFLKDHKRMHANKGVVLPMEWEAEAIPEKLLAIFEECLPTEEDNRTPEEKAIARFKKYAGKRKHIWR